MDYVPHFLRDNHLVQRSHPRSLHHHPLSMILHPKFLHLPYQNLKCFHLDPPVMSRLIIRINMDGTAQHIDNVPKRRKNCTLPLPTLHHYQYHNPNQDPF